MLLQFGSYDVGGKRAVVSGVLHLPLLLWNPHFTGQDRGDSGQNIFSDVALKVEPYFKNGVWVERGSPDFLAALKLKLSFNNRQLEAG